jgi:hypothetical protein
MNIILEIPEDLVTLMSDEYGFKKTKIREAYHKYAKEKLGHQFKPEIQVAEFKYWLATEPDYTSLIDQE